MFTNEKFLKIESTDFTTFQASLRDLLSTSIKNGLEVLTENELVKVENKGNEVIAHCKKGDLVGKNWLYVLVEVLKKFTSIKIKKSLAPIAVVKNVPPETKSFVELDYFKKTCINIITKGSRTE